VLFGFVQGNLLFMSGGDAKWTPGLRRESGFPPEPPPAPGTEKDVACRAAAQKDRSAALRIFEFQTSKIRRKSWQCRTCRGSHTHTLLQDPNDKEKRLYLGLAHRLAVKQKKWRDVRAKKRTKIRYRAVSHRK